jgi:hypothetical protein
MYNEPAYSRVGYLDALTVGSVRVRMAYVGVALALALTVTIVLTVVVASSTPLSFRYPRCCRCIVLSLLRWWYIEGGAGWRRGSTGPRLAVHVVSGR